MDIKLNVNGKTETLAISARDSLNEVLREKLGLKGTKRGCDFGGCGSCTIIVDGKAVYSCMYPAARADGKNVLTIEGLGEEDNLSPVQRAFLDQDAFECGYCTPGAIMSAHSLLLKNRQPTDEEIKEAFAGNLCRCLGGSGFVEATRQAMKDHANGGRT